MFSERRFFGDDGFVFSPIVQASSIIFTAILGIGFIVPFFPEFSERIGGYELVGLIYSGFAIARIFSVPTAAIISDRYGRKSVILVGLILYSITSFLYVYSYDFLSLFVVRILHGVASSLILPVSFAYALDYTPDGREGRTASFLGGSLLLGFGLGPAIGGFVGETFGEKYAFFLMGTMGIVALLQSLFFLKDKEERKVSSKPVLDEIKEIFASPVFLTAFFIWFLIIFQRGVIISYSPILFEKNGFDKIGIGFLITIYALFSSAVQYSSGRFVDNVSDRFALSFILGLISSVILIPLEKFYDAVSVSFMFMISGMLSAVVYPLVMAEVGKEAKRMGRVGGTIGFMDWAFSFGNLVGPTTMGFLTTVFGIAHLFAILGVGLSTVFIISFLIYRMIKRNFKK